MYVSDDFQCVFLSLYFVLFTLLLFSPPSPCALYSHTARQKLMFGPLLCSPHPDAHRCNVVALWSYQHHFWMTWTDDAAGCPVQKVNMPIGLEVKVEWKDKHAWLSCRQWEFASSSIPSVTSHFLNLNLLILCVNITKSFLCAISVFITPTMSFLYLNLSPPMFRG